MKGSFVSLCAYVTLIFISDHEKFALWITDAAGTDKMTRGSERKTKTT